MSSNTSNSVVLVEKHYIPLELYQQIYGRSGSSGTTTPSTAQQNIFRESEPRTTTHTARRHSSTTSSSHTANSSNNLFQTVIENFFPRSSQASNVSINQPSTASNAASSTTSSGTRRVLVSDVYLDTNGADEAGLLLFNTLFGAAMAAGGTDGTYNTMLGVGVPNMRDSSSRGLTATEISRSSETYEITGDQQPYSTHGGSFTCSICTNEYESGDDIRRLNRCRHEFHEHCIDTWLNAHNTCPICRSTVIANIDNID